MKNADEHLMTIFTTALDHRTANERAEYLERACDGVPGLRERVEALLRAHHRSVNFLGESSNDRTIVPFAPALKSGTPASADRAFQEESRQLLRSRLILVHLLSLGYVVLATALSLSSPPGDAEEGLSLRPDNGVWWWFAGPFVEGLIGVVALWRSRDMSLRSLRTWELMCFATLAVFNGYDRFQRMAFLDTGVLPAPSTAIGFMGLATLQGFAPLILAYGVLIPNTRWRSLLGVAAFAAVAVAVIPLAAMVNPVLQAGHMVPLILQAVFILMFPAAIAVFAAARASVLQRRTFNAERRAEKMGQYTLKRKLGEGGMGEVWLAEHGLLKRPCAVKLIRPELATNPSHAARFSREVQAVTALSHVNTVRVYDYGQAEDGTFYFVMEYLEGPTLEDLIRTSGPLPETRVVHLLRQLCGAFAEAHAVGLVHRDLKPGNVIIATLGGQGDVAKLLDFGLVHDASADTDERLTRIGMVLGTPAWMCPEQAAGESAVDARGDIYSLGAVAFFALTGRPPFEAMTTGQLLAAHRSTAPPLLTDICPEASADLTAIIDRCLSKAPNDRYQSMTEVLRALDECR